MLRLEFAGEAGGRVVKSGVSYVIGLALWVRACRGPERKGTGITTLGLEAQSCAQLPAWVTQISRGFGGYSQSEHRITKYP